MDSSFCLGRNRLKLLLPKIRHIVENFHDIFNKILVINNDIIETSKVIDENSKKAFEYFSIETKKILDENPKLNSYQRKSLTNEFLIYWNETISIDCEKFWNRIQQNGIELERKDPLQFLLKNKRFKLVEQAIQFKKYWQELSDFESIKKRFTKNELEEIESLSKQDEIKRKILLHNCLKKNQIPKSKYLYFGECMAYYTQTELFNTEFSENETEKLYEIWKNYS